MKATEPVISEENHEGDRGGRWLAIQLPRRVRLALWIVAAVGLVAMEIRQQAQAELLMQSWP